LVADHAFHRGNVAHAKELLEALASGNACSSSETWTWREHQYVGAWTRWVLHEDTSGCLDVLLSVVERHPEDLFALKRVLVLGQGAAGSITRILAVIERAAATSAQPMSRFLHGLWAFALLEQGRYEDAETKAREGLALLEEALGVPDPWLDHCLVQSLYFQGEEMLEDAIEFMESRTTAWNRESLEPEIFAQWFGLLAVLHCESREIDKSLQVFDDQLWPQSSAAELHSNPQVQLAALSLLWRLETRGASEVARPRWATVLAKCRGVTLPKKGKEDNWAPFQHRNLLLDVVLVRALCVNSAADARSLKSFLESVKGKVQHLTEGIGAEAYASIASSIAMLFRHDGPEKELLAQQSTARQELRSLKPSWNCLGGSAVQRGLLLEAVEGPVVCGAPEVNYDKLFL